MSKTPDALPVAAYATSIAGSTVIVDTCYPEAKATGGVLTFAPVMDDCNKVRAHPHQIGRTLPTEGYLYVKSPKLIKALDALAAAGNVPFWRNEDPEVDMSEPCPTDDPCSESATGGNAGSPTP